DVLARYHRLRLGKDNVFFLTGLDEHGQKVQQAAARAGIAPQAHCDRLAPQFVDLWKRLNISNDDFVRTTEPRHTRVVQKALQKPLEDLSISRPKSRLAWGIELPFDPNYVTYVWFDALVNYISVPGYLVDNTHFTKWWPADVHLIGKDILTTHSVYWSTMLKALELEPPTTIFAHGWWTVNGEKMSKSRGNV